MLSATRFQDTVHGANEMVLPLRGASTTQNVTVLCPSTEWEFRNWSAKENGFSTVLFANALDPRMRILYDMLVPFATTQNKLIVVDVGKIPELGMCYRIAQPTVLKMFKQQAVEMFRRPFTPSELQAFVHPPSHPRWRRTESR